jgi:protein gp37
MSIATKIQWCDSTCNPTMGCEGCELWTKKVRKCYAGTLHVRFGGASKGYAPSFEEVTTFPGRMEQATRWPELTGTDRPEKPWLAGYPRLIFVSDMSDSLSSTVEFDYLRTEIIDNVTSELGSRHQWLWLTKRPDRMAQFSRWLGANELEWPANLWAGTSITSQPTTSRIRHLLKVGNESTIRFLSVEPQYEEVDLSNWLPNLNWVIQGGESGHRAIPFQLEWARSMAAQCNSNGVPYFLKQLGTSVLCDGREVTFVDGHAGDWAEWPDDLRIRQMPQLRAEPASHGDCTAASRPAGTTQKTTIRSTPEKKKAASLKV